MPATLRRYGFLIRSKTSSAKLKAADEAGRGDADQAAEQRIKQQRRKRGGRCEANSAFGIANAG